MTTAAHILDQMTKQPYDDDVWFKKVFLPTIGKYIAAQVRPLQKRIEELENKTANWKYVGTFKSGEGLTRRKFLHIRRIALALSGRYI